jgi:hypothetical protein
VEQGTIPILILLFLILMTIAHETTSLLSGDQKRGF